jgi:ADP-ribosylation factor GTPase-activating protein 1
MDATKPDPDSICADCDATNPSWMSVSHGCFVCENCAEEHKKLTEHVSLLKRREEDLLTDVQRGLMERGGNERLAEWFDKYHIIKTAPQHFKYRTKAAKQYRDKLMAAAVGETYALPDVSPEEGLTDMDKTPEAADGQAGDVEGNEEDPGMIGKVGEFIEGQI